MTRWKREFRLWCKREGLRVYAIPKRPECYTYAKLLSRLVDEEMKQQQPELDRAFKELMLFGSTTIVGRTS